MGCWNGTCMISKLPIMSGEPVVGLFLVGGIFSRSNVDGRSYPTDLWSPIGLPIRGRYNDYGNIEEVEPGHEKTLKVILKKIQASPYIDPDNECHQFKMPTDIDELLEQVERGYAGYKGYKNFQLGLALVRQEVWDFASEAGLSYKDYGDKTEGERMRERINENVGLEESIHEGLLSKDKEIADKYMARLIERTAGSMVFSGSGNWFTCGATIDEIMSIAGVNIFLQNMRLDYDVPAGCGSQHGDFPAHASFHEFVTGAANQAQRNWDDEYGDVEDGVLETFGEQGLLPTVKPYSVERKGRGIALYRNGDEVLATNKMSKIEADDIVRMLNEAYDSGFHDCSVELLNDKVSTR